MAVTQKQVDKLIAEKIDGIFYCDLKGNPLDLKVKKGGEAVVVGTEDNEEPTVLQEYEYVRFSVDEKTRLFIEKYLDKLYGYRGLKDPDLIDENDPEVKDLLERAIKTEIETKKITRRRAKLPKKQINAIINRVAKQYRPQTSFAITQLILLSIIFGDVVRVESNSIVVKFDDLEIDEEYWTGARVSKGEFEDIDALDKMLEDEDVDGVFMDRNNKLEVLIAYATAFYNKYPQVMEFITERKILERIMESININREGTSYDDIGFLENRVDELLR